MDRPSMHSFLVVILEHLSEMGESEIVISKADIERTRRMNFAQITEQGGESFRLRLVRNTQDVLPWDQNRSL